MRLRLILRLTQECRMYVVPVRGKMGQGRADLQCVRATLAPTAWGSACVCTEHCITIICPALALTPRCPCPRPPQAIERHYLDNPYHNSTHAADVTQTLNAMIVVDQLHHTLPPLQVLAVVLSAIIHDVAHPGGGETRGTVPCPYCCKHG